MREGMETVGDEWIKSTSESKRDSHSSPILDPPIVGSKNQQEKKLPDEADSTLDHGKENLNKEQRLCHKCNKSLAKSSHLINIAGQTCKWHPECFKCNVCHQQLDRANTCYIYRDKIVCRDDYFKLQQDNSTKCARCRWPIGASDWVRKAGDFVYHLACFSCDICMRQLSTGEQFTIRAHERNGARLLCRLHFAIEPPETLIASSAPIDTSHLDHCINTPGQYEFSYRHHCPTPSLMPGCKFPPHQSNLNQQPDQQQQQQYLHLLASTSQAAMLLERKSDLNSAIGDDLSMDESKRHQHHGPTSTSSSAGSTSALASGLASKSKRVRTTFTEDQLSILQTHFQIDSNPDGQDLERIATITGLSKRVTQVWFQNSRARQKKYMIKRKPSSASSSSVLLAASIGLQVSASGGQNFQFSTGSEGSGSQHLKQLQRQQEPHSRRGQDHDESSAGVDCYQETKWSNMSDRSDVSMAIEDVEDALSRASTSSSSSTSVENQLIVSEDSSEQ